MGFVRTRFGKAETAFAVELAGGLVPGGDFQGDPGAAQAATMGLHRFQEVSPDALPSSRPGHEDVVEVERFHASEGQDGSLAKGVADCDFVDSGQQEDGLSAAKDSGQGLGGRPIEGVARLFGKLSKQVNDFGDRFVLIEIHSMNPDVRFVLFVHGQGWSSFRKSGSRVQSPESGVWAT